jgi:hypothetical protein
MSTFPEPNSIPPAYFYNMQGLSNWLNNHPTYKQYFINYPNEFPNLYSQSTINNLILFTPNSTMSSIYSNYNIENVPLAPFVTTLSQYQSMKYRDQFNLFINVYTHNSNAYVNYVSTGSSPIYYSFRSYKDLMEYKASVALMNKLYPFDAMANGTNENGSTLGWRIPFPL